MSDLPLHVVYKITRSLDLRSQRNLFLCSSQFYSKWQLHVPDDVSWQFAKQCVNLMEKASADGLLDFNSSISLDFGASLCWYITCQHQQQSIYFNLKQAAPINSDSTPTWSAMTKSQLWHRLTGAPDLASAEFSCNSHPELLPSSDGLKAFAQQSFDLLCMTKGLLLMFMKGLEESSKELARKTTVEEGCHILHIAHAADPKDPAESLLVWEIDNEKCIVNPPNIVFEDMPEEITAIRAHFYSQHPNLNQVPDIQGLPYFNLESQVIQDFAYKGNVDIDAWVDMQHEAANDWYEHMGDFDNDFDDLLDLDDNAMANLLGAMQG